MDDKGRITIFNAFTRLTIKEVPYLRPRFAIVAWFSPGDEFEMGHHQFAIDIKDPSGETLVRAEGEMNIKPNALTPNLFPGEAMIPIVGEISPLEVRAFGQHQVEVSLDGTQVTIIPFRVVQDGS